MFMTFYRFYRTLSVSTTISFAIMSATLFVLFKPKPNYAKLRMGHYTMLGAVSFSLLFQGVLLPIAGFIFSSSAHYFYYFFCSVFLSMVWSCLLLQGSTYSKLLYTLFFVASMQIYRGIFAPLYRLKNVLEPELYARLDVATTVGLYLLLLLLTLLFRRVSIQSSIVLDRQARIAMLYIVISLLLAVVLPVYLPSSIANSCTTTIVLSDIPIVYYIFSRVIRDYEEQRRLDTALARAEADLASYQGSLELRSRIRQERHELKNRYFHLQVLMQNKKYAELEQELEKVIGAISEDLRSLETGSTYLDYLLASKEQQAKEYGIPFHVDILLPEQMALDDVAVGTVLANLLDNAIEASRQETTPEISVSMRCIQSHFYCQVSNHVTQNVLVTNPALNTTKEDAASHGYGLKIIRKTLQEQDGMLNISVEDERFVVTVMLPLKQVS